MREIAEWHDSQQWQFMYVAVSLEVAMVKECVS